MNFQEVPIGFSMALALNESALASYGSMSSERRQAVLERARNVGSRQEMRELVDSLPGMMG